ncbi:hypothetical protein PVAND_011527 [Polypedilum vanderplanki]|uniref:Ig-like domain-containing protein n=1 Tax=Polypedilum vanderplanki TaxID=319348 RepID=A0A9J6CKE1_POLVA|nr:hypothetical protein PVAND_011527 [Polypedilum vanderplanki]
MCLNIVYAKSDIADRPYFGENPRNITAIANESVILKCTVRNKGNRTISWIRKRDLAILTSNTFVYTTDTRFSVIHITDTNNWDLRIKPVNERDQGLYECQINTEPKINFPIFLEVINDSEALSDGSSKIINRIDGKVLKAKISGPSNIQVQKGSTISLTCSVNLQASLILWYHNSTIVDYTRGGLNLENEKTSEGITSRLLLTRAKIADTGNYSCHALPHHSPDTTASTHAIIPDSVLVQVL